LENPLATRVWSAAKTGTSKDMRDNWCIGYTSRYTVGVWVGNFSGAPMRDVSGVTGAAPIWRDVVHWLHRTEGSARPQAPAGITQRVVAFEPSIEGERREWFVAGTAMQQVRANQSRGDDDARGSSAVTPRIRYPAPGSIIALDPDIPPAHQRVAFVASSIVAGTRWKLDGKELPPDRHGHALWPPTPGSHALVLEDAYGVALSRVEFEVRGFLAVAAPSDRGALTANFRGRGPGLAGATAFALGTLLPPPNPHASSYITGCSYRHRWLCPRPPPSLSATRPTPGSRRGWSSTSRPNRIVRCDGRRIALRSWHGTWEFR
jgi:hypothetical protein